MRLIITALALAGVLLTGACTVPEDPAPVQGAEGAAESGDGKASKKAKPPIGLKARLTTADPSPLSTGGALTCVAVTVTNNSKKVVNVNPLYFAITDGGGIKHDASTALGEYEGQVDTMDLAPGEKAKGKVCAKGRFAPRQVSMTNELFSTAARARVAK